VTGTGEALNVFRQLASGQISLGPQLPGNGEGILNRRVRNGTHVPQRHDSEFFESTAVKITNAVKLVVGENGLWISHAENYLDLAKAANIEAAFAVEFSSTAGAIRDAAARCAHPLHPLKLVISSNSAPNWVL
jgi:hypothetical protein